MTDDRVMEILKRVEKGEISPDEAVSLIEDLEASDEMSDSSDPGNKDRPVASKILEDFGGAPSEVKEASSETEEASSGAEEELGGAEREVGEQPGGVAGDIREALGEAAREIGKGISEAAQEVGEELKGVAEEVGEELKEAAEEVREELKDAADEVRENLESAQHDAGEVLKELGSIDAIVDGLNAVFTGLGEGLRAMFRGGRGGEYDSFPKFEFVDVREGSFATELPELDFGHHNGNVVVDSWDRDTYRLEVKKIVKAPDEEQARKRAEESVQVIDSPGCLGVRLREKDTRGVSVSIRATVPSHLRYAGKFTFHNGSVSLERLQTTNCVVTMHNGKLNLRDLSADRLVSTCHNGKANFEHVDAVQCVVTMHNGKVHGDARCSSLAVTMHNGDARLGLSTRNELDCAVTAHNGRIGLNLEKADDIGYRVEYRYKNGRAHTSGWPDAFEEIESVKPKQGTGDTKWVGQSSDYASRPRKISARCSLHNGTVSIGWEGLEKASSDG